MEKTCILVVTHHGLSDQTATCIGRLKCPSHLTVRGMANICRARSVAFDTVIEGTRDAGDAIDTVLCIDDDMVFSPDDARAIVRESRIRKHPVSGVAMTQDGALAARRMPLFLGTEQRWLTGLAFMAVPLADLRRVAASLTRVGKTRPWALTGAHSRMPGEWIGEDFWFCLHFDGVILSPIPIGHLKQIPLFPDDATLESVRHGLVPEVTGAVGVRS